MSSLQNQVRDRIAQGKACDFPGEWLPVQPAICEEELADAERMLGFQLPELLRTMYKELGNGGFGPAFGLIPISAKSLGDDPPVEAECTLVEEYARVRRRSWRKDELNWPDGVVHGFYCGGTVFEFVDCAAEPYPVFWYDEGTEPLSELHQRRQTETVSLEERWLAWLAQKRLW